MSDYSYYHRRLAGLDDALPDIDKPAPGFYRFRTSKNGRMAWEPVAIFQSPVVTTVDGVVMPPRTDGPLQAVRGTPPQEWEWKWCVAQWPNFCAHVVPEADCRKAFATGEWPDEIAGLGHNMPPELSSDPLARAAFVQERAEEWLRSVEAVANTAQADQAAQLHVEARRLAKDLVDAGAKAAAPYAAMAAQATAPFQTAAAKLEPLSKTLKARVLPFMAEHGLKNVGGTGHKLSMKRRDRIVVTDALKVIARHPDHKDVLILAEKLGRAEVKEGVPHPGVEVHDAWSVE